MRLGVAGMLPASLAEVTADHLHDVRKLGLSGAGIALEGSTLPQVAKTEVKRVREQFEAAGMDLVQLGVGYKGCLFDPDDATRAELCRQVYRGIEISHGIGALFTLIRTGSLSPTGSYSPCRANHAPECRPRLMDSLRRIAAKAEEVGQTVVVETHVLTIMNSPETNAEIIAEVGSERLRVVMDYVNHFQALHQVYNSTERLNFIFDMMGSIAPMGHCKDICVRDGFVTHFDEEIPGEGELDLNTAMRRWHELHPDGYMLLEHLPVTAYPLASQNVHRILRKAKIPVY